MLAERWAGKKLKRRSFILWERHGDMNVWRHIAGHNKEPINNYQRETETGENTQESRIHRYE